MVLAFRIDTPDRCPVGFSQQCADSFDPAHHRMVHIVVTMLSVSWLYTDHDGRPLLLGLPHNIALETGKNKDGRGRNAEKRLNFELKIGAPGGI